MLNLRQLSSTPSSDTYSGPHRPSQISTPIFAVVGNAGELLDYNQANDAEAEGSDANVGTNLSEAPAQTISAGGRSDEARTEAEEASA